MPFTTDPIRVCENTCKLDQELHVVERLALRRPIFRQDPETLVTARLSRYEVDVVEIGEAQRVNSVKGDVSLGVSIVPLARTPAHCDPPSPREHVADGPARGIRTRTAAGVRRVEQGRAAGTTAASGWQAERL